MSQAQTAMFVERDGVLLCGDGLCTGAGAVVRRMNLAGVPVVVCGNLDEQETAEDAAQGLRSLLEADGGGSIETYLAGVEDAARRLPRPGALLAATQELGLDLLTSWMIAASDEALRAAANAGCLGAVLVGGGAAPKGLAITVNEAADLADAPRVMVPPGGGCWHDHR